MTAPEISIVTAAYNSANYIKRTLESVQQQTINKSRIEHIVVDDGSTDRTAEIVESFGASYVHLVKNEQNSGDGTVSCNQGIEQAEGEYIVILDSDDEFLPSLVEREVNILATHNRHRFRLP
ncbi:glycosyltransferase family 2 protein [Haladaptatus pallidirubidus]|uniref:Glycosyltransferase 2-like domain-containing protein n=1 Tax=Haladaptatus pallidirubidus TaxID=1008152 RepID=A0AAV3UJX4_9EURY|nr:glycosyltransferase family A protein [Haladaptatus pallidirubidus]